MIKMPKISDDKLLFFVAYARFEFALKENGYLSRSRGIARADWHTFARDPRLADVMQVAAQNAEVTEMIDAPPKLQFTEGDGKWRWENCLPSPIISLEQFFLAVKQVRDNLFHGGKSGEDPRDDRLCKAALLVLALCLDRHHDVRHVFEYAY